ARPAPRRARMCIPRGEREATDDAGSAGPPPLTILSKVQVAGAGRVGLTATNNGSRQGRQETAAGGHPSEVERRRVTPNLFGVLETMRPEIASSLDLLGTTDVRRVATDSRWS